MTDMRESARELAKLIVGRSCDLCPLDDVTVCDCTEAALEALQAVDRAAREECAQRIDQMQGLPFQGYTVIANAIRASIRQ